MLFSVIPVALPGSDLPRALLISLEENGHTKTDFGGHNYLVRGSSPARADRWGLRHEQGNSFTLTETCKS